MDKCDDGFEVVEGDGEMSAYFEQVCKLRAWVIAGKHLKENGKQRRAWKDIYNEVNPNGLGGISQKNIKKVVEETERMKKPHVRYDRVRKVGKYYTDGVFRSKYEIEQATKLDVRNISFAYEPIRVSYNKIDEAMDGVVIVPKDIPNSVHTVKVELQHTYTPDFKFDNGMFVEFKGEWDKQYVMKHKMIRYYHPKLDIRLVFQDWNKTVKIDGLELCYKDWCDVFGWKCASKNIPEGWLKDAIALEEDSFRSEVSD